MVFAKLAGQREYKEVTKSATYINLDLKSATKKILKLESSQDMRIMRYFPKNRSSYLAIIRCEVVI